MSRNEGLIVDLDSKRTQERGIRVISDESKNKIVFGTLMQCLFESEIDLIRQTTTKENLIKFIKSNDWKKGKQILQAMLIN